MKHSRMLGILCALSLTPFQARGVSGAFSVADSIRMQRFNTQSVEGQPAATIVNDSPNHAFGLVLTSRGLIESNEIQSTISLFDYRKLQDAFNRPSVASESLPLRIATITAIPRIDARGAGIYGSVIFNLRWSADSKMIYFLARHPMEVGDSTQYHSQLVLSALLRRRLWMWRASMWFEALLFIALHR